MTIRQGIEGSTSGRRKFDVSLAFKSEEETTADKVPTNAVGLDPIPGVTQLVGQLAAAVGGIVCDQPADEVELFSSDLDAVDYLLPPWGRG